MFPAVERADGVRRSVTKLERADIIGVYFSAHWCPPCRGFTPVLAKIYNKLREQNKKFEIVFVSSDENEEQFRLYHSSMPWLALPFEYRAEKEKLSEKFQVEGIPTLVLLSKSGEIISQDGRELIMSWGAEGFPYTAEHLDKLTQAKEARRVILLKESMSNLKLFGEEALRSDGSLVKLSVAAESNVIALLFGNPQSASFVRRVCPVVAKICQDVRAKHGEKALEMLYVPWEAEEDDVEAEKELRASFPGLSLERSKITPQMCEVLEELFGEYGHHSINVPSIALITNHGEKLININAIREIYETKSNGYPWTTEALLQLKRRQAQELQQVLQSLNEFKFLENHLIIRNEKITNLRDFIQPDTIVGLYFSAHWCGPCRGFTPRLIEVYNELKQQSDKKKFEIIFISKDEDQEAFNHYYETMPWLALNYSERDLEQYINEIFRVRGIPTLILFDATGKKLNDDAREAIMAGAEFFPWGPTEMKRYAEVREEREAEARAKAIAKEEALLDEQKQRENGVLERIRGILGVTDITVDHKITFGAFDTVGAPSHVTNKGKVFYEIEIISLDQGIQQFGWADLDFEFTESPNGEGVGDDENSFGIDGSRLRRWHNGSTEYGLSWKDGDIIGCAANLDDGTIHFGLNGNWELPMGLAFEGIAPTGGLFPALTADKGTFRVNLGGQPFKYGPPDATYLAVVVK